MNLSGNYLLDTNIVIGAINGEPTIQEKLQNGISIFLAVPIVGELYYGAQKSAKVTENIVRINTFVKEHVVLPCDLETARQYGNIKEQLSRKGRLIPDNDIWIAAIAMQYGLVLVTRDVHFDAVETLQTERW